MLEPCAVLDWAVSGAMALTGKAGGAPVASSATVLAMLDVVIEALALATRETGSQVRAGAAELIMSRAGFMGLTRRG
jgi:hypothetical protein